MPRSAKAYERFKKERLRIGREESAHGRDIAPLPKVVNAAKKKKCRLSFRLFCETYLAERFPLAWSADHLKAIEKLQIAVLEGGRFAFAMPRGSGKTALCESGVLWATLYGHRRFVVLVGSSADAAEDSLSSLRMQLETNDHLHEDFGEVTHYIRALEGNAARANMQTVGGVRTRIGWKGKALVYPTVPGSVCSGARIRIAGMDGRIRGLKATTATGETVRPDLALVDDPQTDESAHSPSQNHKRERILNGAVLGLAGPKTKIAAFMP